MAHLGAVFVALAGTVGVIGLSLGMNAQVEKKKPELATVVEAMAAPESRPRGPARKARSSPVKKARSAAPAASAPLAAGLPGFDFGLGGGAEAGMGEATAALLDEVGGKVVDESAVEVAPQAVERGPPAYPSRARAQGVGGRVTLSFVVDVDGRVQDVVVVEAEPPGIFDEAAVEAVRAWRFEPGLDEGAPVAVRVRQTLRFELE